MALFVVPVKKIEAVWPHPNADRLEMARMEGVSWQFVVAKGEYQPGDTVVYFPIDSVLPERVIELLGVRAFLAGPGKNRVRTARLRGEISQGLVMSRAKLALLVEDPSFEPALETDLRELLGVTKYEPPPIFSDSIALVAMPEFVVPFDIEGVDNFPHIAELLMDLPVIITEKLEGTNFWCSVTPAGEIRVGQRNYAIRELEGRGENVYWRCARRQGIIDLCLDYARTHSCVFTLRGELLGPKIQDNYYELPDHRVMLFAAEANGQYLPSAELFRLLPDPALGVPQLTPPTETKPMTLREWLAGRSVRSASDGQSLLNPRRLREGIVVVPAQEQSHPQIGRLILKQRAPLYLAKTDF